MLTYRELGNRVLELLAEVDLERPKVDEERAGERLQAYTTALGLPAPRLRWMPDLRALRSARVYSADRGWWPAFSGRESWLLDDRWSRASFGALGRSLPPPPDADHFPGVRTLADTDRIVLGVGLGSSRSVAAVRYVTQSLRRRALPLSAGTSPTLKRPNALVPLAEAAAAGLFAFAVGSRGDFVAVTRPHIRFDDEGRLHDWSGLPATEWPGGRGLYFWRGVEMTESAGRNPDKLTPARVARWQNAERRRVAIERMGIERFITGLDARVVQQDDYGRLWRTEREIDGEAFVAVEVVNATEEPDGSPRRYFLRVPPEIRSARRAVAWSFGLTAKAYAPVVES